MLGIKEQNIDIYIVDDDKLMLKILSTKFDSISKYNVKTFTTGEAFLEYFIKYPPSKKSICLLVLDYQLSTKENKDARNGIEILKFVKEINENVHVVIHSSNNDVEVASKAIELGARTFIKKNENSFLRINNQLKSILSEVVLEKKRTNSKATQIIFGGLLFLFSLLVLYHFIVE